MVIHPMIQPNFTANIEYKRQVSIRIQPPAMSLCPHFGEVFMKMIQQTAKSATKNGGDF